MFKLRRLFGRLGVDQAIAFTLLERGWLVLSGPISILMLTRYLSGAEQGIYYTFASVLAMQTFLELGFGFVIFQFATHEKARLEWNRSGVLEGDSHAKTRLSLLLRLGLKWYCGVAFLALCLLLPAGLLFFGSQLVAGVSWQTPWVWITVIAAVDLLLTPIVSLIQGCGLMSEAARIRTMQAIVANVSTWALLFVGWKLQASPTGYALAVGCKILWLAVRQRVWLTDLFHFAPRVGSSRARLSSTKEPAPLRVQSLPAQSSEGDDSNGAALDWKREVWPFQWKTALSSISAYFVFALFNPVLFAFQGPEEAGRMGLSLTLVFAVLSSAGAWVGTKAPQFGALVAQRDWKELDRLFFPAMWRSMALVVAGFLVLWTLVFWLNWSEQRWSTRILQPLPLALLMVASTVNHLAACYAVYLRAHKEEPLLGLSVAVAIVAALSTYFTGKYLGVTGMIFAYASICMVTSLGIASWIFQSKRRLWHAEPVASAQPLNQSEGR